MYDPEFEFWNQVVSICSFCTGGLDAHDRVGNMLWSFKNGKKAGPNPWGARTLEWMISSPPPYYNFKKVPAVLSAPYDFGNPLAVHRSRRCGRRGRDYSDPRT